jgi:hypothetical protein
MRIMDLNLHDNSITELMLTTGKSRMVFVSN